MVNKGSIKLMEIARKKERKKERTNEKRKKMSCREGIGKFKMRLSRQQIFILLYSEL
jgi:hypothetical protein